MSSLFARLAPALACGLCVASLAHGEALPGGAVAPAPAAGSPVLQQPAMAPPADPAARVRWLNSRIDEILATSPLGRAKVGVSVLELESGRLLYARNDALALNPASNVKLITTAAALSLLGPEFRFKTVLYIDREWRSGRANLYLRGYGDPTLQIEDLWRLCGELSARGIRSVADVVIDDTYFDEQRIGPGFDQKPEDAAFRAPQGAVSVNLNAVGVRVLPGGGDGAPARVLVDPPSPYFLVHNEARTVGRGRTSLVVESKEEEGAAPGHERTVLRVRGVIKTSDGGQEFWKRIAHPDLYTGHSLRELLVRRGIKVSGKVVRGAVPQTAVLLGTHYSAQLGVLVRDINKRSNNFMAEQVLKALGAEIGGKPGTWRKGLDAVARYMEGLGIPPSRYQMNNGSGLYDANRFAAAQLTAVLRAVSRDFRYAADFIGSLGVAGADGTIGHRMSGGLAERFIRAKTGTLLGVSCLSGYASAPAQSGQAARGPLAFSILMNDLPEDGGPTARQVQDAIGETLVLYLGGAPEARAAGGPR